MATAENAYEAKRQQRIAANRAMLQSLGIAPVVPKRSRVNVNPRGDMANSDPDGEQEESVRGMVTRQRLTPARRSRRLQEQHQEKRDTVRGQMRKRKQRTPYAPPSPPRGRPRARRTGSLPSVPPAATVLGSPPVASTQSASCMELELDMANFHAQRLGRVIWPRGKQAVVDGLCPTRHARFSKMSGILAWKNAVVLFVNLQGSSGYANVFSEARIDGKAGAAASTVIHFRWFAQARQHEGSPVIQRLLQAPHGHRAVWLDGTNDTKLDPLLSESASPSPREHVLLFLRHVDGPYIYCGQLGLLGCVAHTQPLEFRWQLLDINAAQWQHVKQLVDAGADGDGTMNN